MRKPAVRPKAVHDPFGPIVRDPRTRKDRDAATRDMAGAIRLFAVRQGEATDEDLIRAGFSLWEIEHLHAGAMAIVEKRQRRTREETVLDMAALLSLRAEESLDHTVTRADLHRGGFTDAEIDACHGAAVAAMAPGRGLAA